MKEAESASLHDVHAGNTLVRTEDSNHDGADTDCWLMKLVSTAHQTLRKAIKHQVRHKSRLWTTLSLFWCRVGTTLKCHGYKVKDSKCPQMIRALRSNPSLLTSQPSVVVRLAEFLAAKILR